MLYNKNRFKKVNAKKILHKVKKQWVTISIALLGLLGVKSIATHVNVNADVTSANNNQANHQLKSDQLQSGSSTLVQSNGASLTSASTNSASSVAAPSASVSASSNGTRASQGNRYQLNVSSAAHLNYGSASLNVPSAAEKIHNDVLSGYAQKNQAQNNYSSVSVPGVAKLVHHMLGEAPSSSMSTNVASNLLNPNNLIHIVNDVQATHNSAAYDDIINRLSASTMTSLAKTGATMQGYINYTQALGNDVSKIVVSNPSLSSKVNSLMNYVGEASLGASLGYLKAGNFTLNNIASALQDPGEFMSPAHQGGAKSLVISVIDELPGRQNMINAFSGMATVATNPSDANDYQKMMNDVKALNTSSKDDQVKALRQLASDTKTLANSVNGKVASALYLNQISSDAESMTSKSNGQTSSNNASTTATSVDNNVTSISNAVTSLENSYKNVSLASNAYTVAYHSDLSQAISYANEAVKWANAAVSDAAKVGIHISSPVQGKHLLGASPVSQPAYVTDENNASKYANLSSHSLGKAKQDLNNSKDSAAYDQLLNSYEGPLFSDMVNRITASNFNSGAFNTLVSNAKNDLKHATTASAFVNELAGQDGAFDGVTAKSIKSDLSAFANNTEFNEAYSAASADPSDADQILTDLTNLQSNNEAGTLDNIASIANSHFSNSTLFGQLSNDANSIVDTSQAASTNESTAVNNLVSGLPASAALSFVASKFASNGFNKYGKFDHLFSQAEDAFDNNNASNASEFLHNFAGQAKADFPAADDGFINTALNSLESNPAVSDAYSMLRDNRAATKSILNDFATMTPENESNALGSVASTIKATSSFSNNSAISNVADLVTSAATSASTSEASNYSNLLKVAEGPLFSAMVNRIVANGFKSNAFKDLVSDAKSDLTKAPTASAFINDLTSQDGAFDGATAKAINNYLSGYANNPELNSAYSEVSANSSAADNILNELSGMNSNNEADELGSIASNASAKFSDSALFGSLANDASGMQNSVESNAYQDFLKNDEGLLFNAVVNRITAKGFNSGAFTSLVNAAEGDLANASTASDFVKSMSGQTNSFTGDLTHKFNSYMSSFANNPYVNAAYQAVHGDTSDANRMLGDLSNMANQPSNKANDLNDIASVAKASFSNASSFGNLASDASSMYKSVSNSASSANTKPASKGNNNGGKKTPAKPTDTNINLSNIVYYALKDITSKNFDAKDFGSIVNGLINENFITYDNTLSELWSDINNPQYSKSFPNILRFENNNVGKAIVSIINNPTLMNKLSAAYTQIYGDTQGSQPSNSVQNIYTILNDFVSIANNKSTRQSTLKNIIDTINGDSNIISAINNHIDHNGVNNIDTDISDFETGKVPANKSSNSTKGGNSSKNNSKKSNKSKNTPKNNNTPKNKPKKPNTPNKKPSNDTNLVDKAINSNSIKTLADHLASSKAPANLGDIINNLEALPDPKLSTMDFNGKLSKISDDLNSDKGSFIDVNKVNQVLNDINGHDANPAALDSYANTLSDPEKTLVKDFNAGIQYLKNDGQNADNDYNSVLNDLLDIKNHPSHEDHDLSNIAKTINKGKGNLKGLHVLKLFASASHQAAKKDYQPIKANNRKQQKQDGKRHASYMAAKIQQKKDAARHNQIKADKAQHNKDVARHKQILADKAQHDKDTQRHNHIENMSALAEANSAARAAATYYRKDSAAAASAQKFAKGLKPGSDSDLASHAASQASGYASLAGTFESEAISADQQAKLDINKSGINNYVAVHTDAEMASDKANTTNYLFSGISDQLMSASTDATAAGYKPASNSGSTSSSSSSSTSASGSTKSSSTSSSSVAPSSSSASTSSSSTSSSTQSSSTSSSSVAPSSSSSVPTSSSTTSYVPSSTVTPSYTPNLPSSTNYFPTSESTMPSSSVTFNSGYSEGSSVSSEVSSSASIEMTNDTDPDQLGIHQAMKSGKATVERVAPLNYWFDVSQTCLAHNHIGSVGKVKDYSLVLHTGDLAQLEKVFVVKQGKHTYYRYEVKFDGHNYYVTANAKFTRKAYCQSKDLKKARQHGRRGHRYYNAVVIMPCLTHRSVRYTNDNAIRPVLRNQVVKIKKIIKIGRKGYGMTRFELTDGTFITSNRDFIKLL